MKWKKQLEGDVMTPIVIVLIILFALWLYGVAVGFRPQGG